MRLRNRSLLTLAVSFAGFSPAWSNCFDVNEIAITGASLIEQEVLDEISDPLEGTCVGLPQIDFLMRSITAQYIEGGFVTARAYLPQQDLSDGVLDIRIVEGALETVLFDGEERRAREYSAFGDVRDKPVNLRTVEQGLDNIRAVPSVSAEMELGAGSQDGLTVLDIRTETGRPYRLTFSTNNYGSDESEDGSSAATGQFSNTLGFGYDNLLGLNDQWDFSLTKSVRHNPFNIRYNGPGTDGWSIGAKVPFGRMQYGFTLSHSSYDTFTDGALSPIELDGWTRTASLNVQYLLFRDKDRKDNLMVSLERRENENYIADVLISASSRVLSKLRIGYSSQRTLEAAQFGFDFGLSRGLDIWGAEDFSDQPEGQPNAQFTKFDFRLNYLRPFPIGEVQALYRTEFAGQYSGDRLYGNEQIYIGGSSTVRGSKSSVASGNSGAYWRNQLELPNAAQLGERSSVSPYLTVDFGRIFEQSRSDVPRADAAGASLGFKIAHPSYSLDASIGRLLSAPDGREKETELLLSFLTRF